MRGMAATPLGAAAEAALKSALQREHGGIKLNAALVTPLVAYFAGRGEAVTELPLDYPLRGTEDFERRWLAKLRAAGVADEGDQVDFILWTKARAAPGSAGGAATATGLAKVALLALEAAGDASPSLHPPSRLKARDTCLLLSALSTSRYP